MCILCAFDEDHSETLRSFKFVHFNVWSTTEGIVSTILDSLSCRGFWLAVKLYRHTGTLSLFDPSLCDCMDSLCSDHWQAVVVVGCLVLARLPILHCPVVLTSRRTKGVVCCVLSSEHANMKYRNIDFLGKLFHACPTETEERCAAKPSVRLLLSRSVCASGNQMIF